LLIDKLNHHFNIEHTATSDYRERCDSYAQALGSGAMPSSAARPLQAFQFSSAARQVAKLKATANNGLEWLA